MNRVSVVYQGGETFEVSSGQDIVLEFHQDPVEPTIRVRTVGCDEVIAWPFVHSISTSGAVRVQL